MKRAWIVLAALAACAARNLVGSVLQHDDGQPLTDVSVHDVDLLFMIDNSRSMQPKQERLKAQFSTLIAKLGEFAASGHPATYHIGVVTSDLAAGPLPSAGGGTAPSGTSGCRMNGSIRGDGGRLVNVGAAADKSCRPIDSKGGGNFIVYDQLHSGADGLPSNNFPFGQDLKQTFSCMASVGDGGCGMEHQLESVYQALQPPMLVPGGPNAGFLRDDALLVVVFLTDEDDCSAPPDTDLFAQDGYTLKDGRKAFDELGYFHSFRCTEWGIKCGGKRVARDQMAARTDCQPLSQAEGGKLFDVQRYSEFFRNLKGDPRRVLLASIAAPPDSVKTIFATCDKQQGSYLQDAQSCGTTAPLNDNQCMAEGEPYQMCSVVLQHSCQSQDAALFGDPAVRLSAVLSAQFAGNLPKHATSICDDDYSATLDDVAAKIRNVL